MKTVSLSAALVAILPLIEAHTRFTTLFINGQSQGDGTCIRMNMDPSTTTAFVNGISSDDMACGVQGGKAVDRTCPAKAGDSISLLHRSWADGAQPGSIDPSHKGSAAVYMKKIADAGSSDPYSTPAAGDGWFKISYTGFDTSTNQWGTEKMIANDGIVATTIPSDLPGGYYLIRSELLAMQNIVNEQINPQFYVGCAQVYVEGAGSTTPSSTAAIPGYIDGSTPALSYNIYKQTPPAQPFQEFGPAVYGSSASGKRDIVGRDGGWHNYNFNSPTPECAQAPASSAVSTFRTSVSAASNPDTASRASSFVSSVASVSLIASSSIPAQFSQVASSAPAGYSPPARSSAAASPPAKSSYSVPASSAAVPSPAASSPAAPSPAATSSAASRPSSSTSPSSSFVGSCPADTVLEVGNQCLTEVPSWSGDTAGYLPKCWAASQSCWDALDVCWNNLSPAVQSSSQTEGCNLWNARCTAIVDRCHAGNTQGPPAAGKVLTPAKATLRKRDVVVLGRRSEVKMSARDSAAARNLTRRMLSR